MEICAFKMSSCFLYHHSTLQKEQLKYTIEIDKPNILIIAQTNREETTLKDRREAASETLSRLNLNNYIQMK